VTDRTAYCQPFPVDNEIRSLDGCDVTADHSRCRRFSFRVKHLGYVPLLDGERAAAKQLSKAAHNGKRTVCPRMKRRSFIGQITELPSLYYTAYVS